MDIGSSSISSVGSVSHVLPQQAQQLPQEEKQPSSKPSFLGGLREMAFGGALNGLLLCIPIAFISQGAGWPDTVTFIFSLLAIAPLAERLGFVTEQLALHTNETIGGLLNVTFGNATELIVAIAALFKGLYRVVQLTLLGSVLSNLLLVLGCAFLFGGLKFKVQRYGKITSQVNMTLLMLSVMALLFPTVLVGSISITPKADLNFSRSTSIILFLLYVAYLYFQLFTHKSLYDDMESGSGSDKISRVELSTTNPLLPPANQGSPTLDTHLIRVPDEEARAEPAEEEDSDDDEEEDVLGFNFALFWLAVITILISFLSDALVKTINDAAAAANVSAIFISAIVIPIIGNAAEHAGAVIFARKNKVDLAISIAVGSSTQIAVMVLPLLVIISWCAGKSLDLDFQPFESITLFLTVVTVTFAIQDGSSTWLVGLALCGAYLIIAIGFLAHTDEDLSA